MFLVLYLFLLYTAYHAEDRDKKSVSTVLWRIFISFYTVSSTVGEFHIRGTKMFQKYISYFTSIAHSLDVGFVPIVCTTSLSFFTMFILKAILPYFIVLSVGLGLCILLRRKN